MQRQVIKVVVIYMVCRSAVAVVVVHIHSFKVIGKPVPVTLVHIRLRISGRKRYRPVHHQAVLPALYPCWRSCRNGYAWYSPYGILVSSIVHALAILVIVGYTAGFHVYLLG